MVKIGRLLNNTKNGVLSASDWVEFCPLFEIMTDVWNAIRKLQVGNSAQQQSGF
jgi:hypothetical protein